VREQHFNLASSPKCQKAGADLCPAAHAR